VILTKKDCGATCDPKFITEKHIHLSDVLQAVKELKELHRGTLTKQMGYPVVEITMETKELCRMLDDMIDSVFGVKK